MGAGNAVAVWAQPETTNYREWGARYVLGTGWQPAVVIQSAPLPSTGQSLVASDASGNAIALWTQSSPTVGGVWGNANLKPAGTWKGALNLAWAATEPALAISPNGHAAVSSQASARIVANLGPVDASAGSGWGNGFNVQAQPMNADSPDIAVNDSGAAVVAWSELDAASHLRIWANRLR
jgi:hypothetical protein